MAYVTGAILNLLLSRNVIAAASRVELPKWVLAQMYANVTADFAVWTFLGATDLSDGNGAHCRRSHGQYVPSFGMRALLTASVLPM